MQIFSNDHRAFEVSETTRASPEVMSWYALTTLSRQEKLASMILESLGITQSLPAIDEERQWSDRKKVITVPLFPGYLFVHARDN